MNKWMLKIFHMAVFVFIFVKPATASTVRFEVDEEKPKDSFVADISQEKVPVGFRRGGFTNIVYEISDNFSPNYLELDRVSGIIRTRVILDREKLALQDDILQVRVSVSADSPGPVSSLMSVEVKIRDINDNPPSFLKKQEFISISESAPLNSRFRLEVAEDPDLGSNSVDNYEIVKGNEEGVFGLNVKRYSGVNLIFLDLMNIKKLDRERNGSFELVIQASDKGHPPLADTKKLNVTILDSNDHSPVFSEDLYTAEVKENLPEGTFVLNVSATDKDLGTNAEIRYFIDKKSQHRELFKLDNMTGELRTKKALDYESGQPGRPYRLTITAKDQGPDSIPVIALASIKIIDENDNTPEISIEPKLFQSDGKLPEDVPLGSVIASVIVSDKDSGRYGEVDLQLSRHEDDFSLNKLFDKQYVVQVKRPLSLDVRTQYELKIVARDRGSPKRKSNKSMTVDLADSNRNAPKFEKSIYTIKLSDDAKPETIVETIAATDADKGTNQQLSFILLSLFDSHQNTSIADTEKWFALDALRGSLRLKTKLWCSFTPSFLITAEVRDHGRTPKRNRCTLNVTVACTKHHYEFRVFERRAPGTKVGDFGADLRLPGKQLLIHLSQGQDPYFTVNNSTGQLTLAKELDREETTSHLLNGFVTDGRVKSPVQVFVRVLDKNDNAPRFIGIDGQISVNIPTNARPGYRVWKVVAKDPDEGRNGKVSFSIINSNGDDAFTIDGEQGHILISKNLTKKSYIVTIRAADNGAKPRQRLVRMKVYLDDTLVLPTLRSSTTDNKVAVGVNARESDKGTFTNKELIIVIVLCTFCGVLIIVLIAVVVAKCKRKSAANKRSSYHEAEISREDALKASKKMYKEATINMYKSAEELQHTKSKNGKAAPLPKKSPLTTSPPTADATWAVREHQSPSTSYMGSEYVGTDCETDSGREDIVHFSPYTTHSPAQKKAHDWRTGSFNSPPQPPPPYTPPRSVRKHCGSASSTLPLKRERKVGKPSLVKIPGVTHSATDL